MAITGKLVSRDGKLYVLYVYNELAEPFRQHQWWRVLEVHRYRFNGSSPEPGDEVTWAWDGRWSAGLRGSVVVDDEAELVERVGVPPPTSRGKPVRWYDGQWERLTAKGWVPAGEGAARGSARRATRGKRQLEREIEQATGVKVQG